MTWNVAWPVFVAKPGSPTAPKSIKLILASSSPRRRELLTAAGLTFSIEPAQGEELSGHGWTARELCELNSEMKAREIAQRFPDDLVLGADTLVSLDNRVFGKPSDLAEARSMLETLSGRVHEVLTGVSLLHHSTNRLCRFIEVTRVKFRPAEEIDFDSYLASINPLDKAGSYAAQNDEGRLIARTEGLMTNVIGLPVERVLMALQEHFPEVIS